MTDETQAPSEPAGATLAPPAAEPEPASPYAFRLGQVVRTAGGGYGLVVDTGPTPRLVDVVLGDGTINRAVRDVPGYVVAALGQANDTPHTAEELGLEAP